MQVAIFFQQLYEVLPQSARHSTGWIVCGDFNMKPHFPAYELVKNGEISENSFEKLKPGKYKYPSLVECEEVISLQNNSCIFLCLLYLAPETEGLIVKLISSCRWVINSFFRCQNQSETQMFMRN